MICFGEYRTCARGKCPFKDACEASAIADEQEAKQPEFLPITTNNMADDQPIDNTENWTKRLFTLEDVRLILFVLFREIDAIEFRIIRAKLLNRSMTLEEIGAMVGMTRQGVHIKVSRQKKKSDANKRLFDVVFNQRGRQGKEKRYLEKTP